MTSLTVAACQRRPPWAVGMPSRSSPSAIAWSVAPAARSRRIRSTTRIGQDWGPTEPDALGALDRERLLRALADQAALELAERGHHVGHRLPARGAGVDAEIEGDEGPAFTGRAVHEGGEVHHRS